MKRLLSTTAISVVALAAASAHAQDAATQGSTQGQLSAQACATNWTTVDSDQNGKISEAEARAATDAEFARIDVDSSGTISVTEWKDCGDRAAYPGVPAGLDKFPQEASSGQGDGQNTSDQTASASGSAQADTMTTSPASPQAKADLQIDAPETTGSVDSGVDNTGMSGWTDEDFSAADTDKSGDLSAQEAAAAGESRFDQSSAAVEDSVRQSSGAFARIDANGDGMISADEFSSRDKAGLSANIEARFSALDADGNKEVSQEEFKRYRDQRFSEARQADQEPTVWHYYFYVL